MAKVTSGSFNTNGEGSFYIRFEWNIKSTNIQSNFHTIQYRVIAKNTPGYYRSVYDTIVNVDGAEVYKNDSKKTCYNDTIIYSGERNIYQNSVGQGSFSANVKAGVGIYSGINITGSGSFQLPDIPRQANIKSAPDFNDEQNPTITYENLAGNSVTSLQACISFTGANDDIPYRNISKTATSYTFNLTDVERNTLRNGLSTNSRSVIFFVRSTIGGTTYLSTLPKTLTLINGNPTFADFEVYDTDPKTTSLLGNNKIFLQGLSDLKIKITTGNKMVTKKSATPVKYIATLEGTNQEIPYSTSEINAHLLYDPNFNGNKTVTVRAYDSRNNSKLVNKTITILPYSNPVINSSIKRLNNFEKETTLTLNGSFSSIKIGNVEKNNIEYIKYRYKEDGGSYNSYTNLTVKKNGVNYSCDNIILDLDNSKKYIFEVVVKDKIYETIKNLIVDIGEPIFFINANGGAECYGKPLLDYEIIDTW